MNLINCFSELIAYTLYIVKKFEHAQPDHNEVTDKYKQLIVNSGALRPSDKLLIDDLNIALFAICAWIDEKILLSNWQDKELWQLNPLQKQYFTTTQAGEKFFEILENLDSVKDEKLIEVFSYCIELGFQGKNFNHMNKANITVGNHSKPLTNLTNPASIKIFSHAYNKQKPIIENKKKRLKFKTFLIMTFLVGIGCVVVLGIIYNILLHSQITGYFK